MYQALYRKWRPATFADVIGQEHITRTLQRQVAEGRLSHAYLFTGTRGTGKTTCARILAKAVNCLHPVDGNPCNECEACRSIDSGKSLDVLELDAASNNGVDSVRALRDEAIYSPASVKKRVYIVDEVHMLSVAAFNALLKILEEPPEHLIFILATTELHKVPATILSRCQRFAFKRIMPEDISARLSHVAWQEKIDLAPDGAALLARLAGGALRDALSLLDQCAAITGTIDADAVLNLLGLAGNAQTARLFRFLSERDAQNALLLLDEVYRSGKDVGAVLGELATLMRDLLIRLTAPKGGAALLSGGFDEKTLSDLSAGLSPQRLTAMLTLVQETLAKLSFSANQRTDAELCLLRMSDESLCGDVTALAARLERLENAVRRGIPAAPAAPAPAPAPAPVPAKKEPAPVQEVKEDLPPWEEAAPAVPFVEDERPPFPTEEPPMERSFAEENSTSAFFAAAESTSAFFSDEPAPKAAPAANASGVDVTTWRTLIEDYKGRMNPMSRVFLDKACGELKGDELKVLCQDSLTMDRLKTDAVATVLKEVTSAHVGHPVRVIFEVGKPRPTTQEERLQNLINFGSQFDSFTIR